MANKRRDSVDSCKTIFEKAGDVYRIKVKGLLDEHWQEWFEGMTLRHTKDARTGLDCTVIVGPIADQPALHGLLAKIRDLNLTLISVRKSAAIDSHKSRRKSR